MSLAQDIIDARRYRWLIAQHWVESEATFRLDLPENPDSDTYTTDIGLAIDRKLA